MGIPNLTNLNNNQNTKVINKIHYYKCSDNKFFFFNLNFTWRAFHIIYSATVLSLKKQNERPATKLAGIAKYWESLPAHRRNKQLISCNNKFHIKNTDLLI